MRRFSFAPVVCGVLASLMVGCQVSTADQQASADWLNEAAAPTGFVSLTLLNPVGGAPLPGGPGAADLPGSVSDPAARTAPVVVGPVLVRGQPFASGFALAFPASLDAPSLTFEVAQGQCEVLSATLGLTEAASSGPGTVRFEVYGDGERLYTSPPMTARSAPQPVQVNMRGYRRLSLVSVGSPDLAAGSRAVWAQPVLRQCRAALMPPLPAPTAQTPPGYADVRTFGARCDGVTDDSVAIQAALDQAGRVYVPPATCVVANLRLNTNQAVLGAGPQSVLLQKRGAANALIAFPEAGDRPDVGRNLSGLRLERFKLRGQAGRVAFGEHVHLLNLSAVSDVLIRDMTFEGFVGDGLYLGSGPKGAERHNERVQVIGSVFDGVVRNNRNAISVIDGTDVVIRGSTFRRSGRPDMPGAVDLEPDANTDAFSRIRDITIDDCEFRDIASSALISVLLRPQDRLGTPARHITISRVRGYGNNQTGQTALAITHSSWGATEVPGPETAPLDLTVSASLFDGVYRPFVLTQTRGVTIRRTVFRNSRTFAALGEGGPSGLNRDVTLEDVLFDRVGYDASVGFKSLTIYSNDGLTLGGVTVRRGTGLGIAFSSGVSSNVTISSSRIVNDSGQLLYGIKRFADHTLSARTNHAHDIELVGVRGNDFVTQGQ